MVKFMVKRQEARPPRSLEGSSPSPHRLHTVSPLSTHCLPTVSDTVSPPSPPQPRTDPPCQILMVRLMATYHIYMRIDSFRQMTVSAPAQDRSTLRDLMVKLMVKRQGARPPRSRGALFAREEHCVTLVRVRQSARASAASPQLKSLRGSQVVRAS